MEGAITKATLLSHLTIAPELGAFVQFRFSLDVVKLFIASGL